MLLKMKTEICTTQQVEKFHLKAEREKEKCLQEQGLSAVTGCIPFASKRANKNCKNANPADIDRLGGVAENDISEIEMEKTRTDVLIEKSKANYNLAIECLDTALKLEKVPNKQILMKTRVIVYEQSGNFAAAKEAMEQYIENYPNDEEAKRELTFLETR